VRGQQKSTLSRFLTEGGENRTNPKETENAGCWVRQVGIAKAPHRIDFLVVVGGYLALEVGYREHGLNRNLRHLLLVPVGTPQHTGANRFASLPNANSREKTAAGEHGNKGLSAPCSFHGDSSERE